MPKHTTRKASPEAKAETIRRRNARKMKGHN